MKLKLFAIILLLGLAPLLAAASTGTSFDEGWQFFKGDAPDAERPGFEDSNWRKLDLPHDWSIEGPFAQTNKTGGAGGWLPSGVGWYRKSFPLPKEFAAKRFFIEFDGVMQNSEVWINGVSLGKRPFGYVSFRYDLTPHLKLGPGQTNVLAVRADTSAQPASRWYSGAGIYRHVRLVMTDAIHFEHNSVFVTSKSIRTNGATIRVAATVTNASAVACEISVSAAIPGPPGSGPDGGGAWAGQAKPVFLAAGASVAVEFDIEIPWYPFLWSLERPDLYMAVVQVRRDGGNVDEERVPFGIRTAEFKSDSGFWLNGKNLKLKGVCLHHDGSAFGAAVPLSVWERRLTNLRELGVNAIRTAHNPVAPEFLDLCDRMGFLVMNELFDCWTMKKNPHDYSLFFNEWSKTDLRDTILRDRNHPSVILWSVGNEIKDTPKQELAKTILKGLVEVCHENDPTRPVTQALFRPNTSGDYTNGLADLLDVIGTNYRDQELLDAWRAKPGRKIVGTEQGHERRTWLACRDNPQHTGQFLWVGVDYLGETKTWPRIAYAGGLLDRTGEIKPMAYERQSWWSDKPMVRVVRRVAASDVLPEDPGWGGEERHTQVQFADWTPRNLAAHDENVEVYSNCDEVELFLNGKSLGTKPINKDASPRTWKVAFTPGTLRAVARNAGKQVAADELRTAGKAANIILTTDRKTLASGWDDVAFVRATVVDENGVVVPRAKDLIRFSISGPGVIAAVDSADNASIEPFQATERRAYQGVCFALIKATQVGKKILITAEAAGLKSGSLAIETPRK
jgi:beta-galactosidase